ncbi:MAG: 16S rRNA (guanine(966)-N(2))-methyltransferase RsmD [Chlorobiaceae bacterium]|nr:16S rRNA (guanine(966)-N(2))-methyltransferase RsmD [Chlorobiaceae bacterium]
MHILAGKYKGRKIRSSSTSDVRPCSSRVKKSIFDTLAARLDFDDMAVLDLFAGFGSLGFEALSRGAGSLTFVDQHVDSLKALKATAQQLGVESRVKIVNADASAFLSRSKECYDLVFCDPPYSWPDYDALIEEIAGGALLGEEGYLLIEHRAHLEFKHSPHYSFHKDYGMTRVTFFQS